jgi:hypothetical protein
MAIAPKPRPARLKRIVAISLSSATAIVILFAPTLVAGWAPVLHWACEPRGLVLDPTTVQVPALLLNAPYRGEVWGNVTFPPGFLPGDLSGMGTEDTNGGADWAGFQANVTVSAVENETVWGPGPNVRCSAPFEAGINPIGNPSEGIPLLGSGNLSDRAEPTVLYPGPDNTVYFSNGFDAENLQNVSTCGIPAESFQVASSHLTLAVRFALAGQNTTTPLNLPLVGSTYHYWFPSNGTWAIDNLSAPGGPGGGWAFDYLGSCT